MNLSTEDDMLLGELCKQHNVSKEKVHRLLDVVRKYDSKERRRGLSDDLREILKENINPSSSEMLAKE